MSRAGEKLHGEWEQRARAAARRVDRAAIVRWAMLVAATVAAWAAVIFG